MNQIDGASDFYAKNECAQGASEMCIGAIRDLKSAIASYPDAKNLSPSQLADLNKAKSLLYSLESSKTVFALNAAKAIGGGLAVATGSQICINPAGCGVGYVMATFGLSEVVEGTTGMYNALFGVANSQTFNPLRETLNIANPKYGNAAYYSTYIGTSLIASGVMPMSKIVEYPFKNYRMNSKSMFDLTTNELHQPVVVLTRFRDFKIPQSVVGGAIIGGSMTDFQNIKIKNDSEK